MENLTFACLGALVVLGAVALRGALASFRAQGPADYAVTAPAFDIRRDLNGTIDCDGVIYGPTGRVTARFVAVFHAQWHGNTGRMTEQFTYDSGATQHREWTLTLLAGGRISATAPDVLGTGEGWQSGAAGHLRYRIRLPEQAGGHVLDTLDWMYLLPNGVIVNRSQMRKFGIPVAELVATMRRRDIADHRALAAE